MEPILALCNIFDQDGRRLAEFARDNGFAAVDWTVDPELPEDRFLSEIGHLTGLEVRYHCRFFEHEIARPGSVGAHALSVYQDVISTIKAAGGSCMTLHIGLGTESGDGLDFESAADNLKALVHAGRAKGVHVCLENLASGWTSDPVLFNRLIQHSGAGITIDIGHVRATAPDDGAGLLRKFLSPYGSRITNCHIYHTELPGRGHIRPGRPQDIFERLHLIRTQTPSRWWVIELQDPADILCTRDIISCCLAEDMMEAGAPAMQAGC